jgi:hypothetical protein
MKPTLYEALGLSQTAAESEIKAALRRLVRRYYAKTRAGHTVVEEALRFLNHASHVLGDPVRRAEYDSELAKGVSTESALTTVGELSSYEIERPKTSTAAKPAAPSITELGIPRDKPTLPVEAVPEWSAQLADFRRTRAGQLAGVLVTLIMLLVAWKLAVPADNAWPTVRFALVATVMTAAIAAVIYASIHVLSRSVWRLPAAESAATIVEGMIPRWRRDRTVFMGTGGPVEDATWLFRLRMAELKRVSAERVSDPQPWMRLFARVFDYGIWGLVLFGLLGLVQKTGPVGAQFAAIIAHPLLAPVIITASWMPVEALLLAQAQTTPGRWLLCVYLHYQVSNPYAPEELRFTFDAAIGRAFDVWWRGCAAGVPVLSMLLVARAREHVARSGETPWDSERDCLVTHGPVGTLSLVALGIGLCACALAYSAWWAEPVESIAASVQRTAASMVHESPAGDEQAAEQSAGPRIARVDDIATPASSGSVAPEPGAAASASRSEPQARAGAAGSGKAGASRSAPTTSASGRVRAGSQGSESSLQPSAVASAPAGEALSPLEQRERRVAVYMQQARAQQARGDFGALTRTCQRWADEDWRNPRAFYCAGLGLQGTGRHKEAIAMFNRAGSLLPNDDPLKIAIGDAVLKSFRAESGG